MRQSQDATKEELPYAVDDAASVILESKRKEAFIRQNAPEEKNSSVSGLTIFVIAILVLVAFSAILMYLLLRQKKTTLGAAIIRYLMGPNETVIDPPE